MPIKLGTTDLGDLKLGTADIAKVMIGSTLVWPTAIACTDVLAEPFDNYAAWSNQAGATIVAGRTGNAVSMASGTGRLDYNIPAAAQSDTLTVGAAHKFATFPVAHDIYQLRSDAGATGHIVVRLNGSGQIQVVRSGGATLGGTATVLTLNTWHYIECTVKLSDTAGTVTVRVDGATVIAVTNVDTRNLGTLAVFDQLRLIAPGAISPWLVDDLYITTGPDCPFQGDHAIVNNGPLLLNDPCNNRSAWTVGGTVTVVAGGFTGNGFQLNSGSTSAVIYNIAAAAQTDTLTVGMRFKPGGFVAGWTPLQLRSDALTTLHVAAVVDASGVLSVRSGTTQFGPSLPLTVGTWYFVEVSTKMHDTLGTVTWRVNGIEYGAATNVDTKSGGTKTVFDTVRIQSAGSLPATWLVDDIYIRNDATFGVT